MNERIQELARQSGAYHKDDDGEETKIAVLIGKEVEKFAELIVRECMELGDKALQDGKWPGDVIEKHFGIEE